MKLSKNGRKTQKAICKALMLGLPLAGLLAMTGCEKEKESKEIVGRLEDPLYDEPAHITPADTREAYLAWLAEASRRKAGKAGPIRRTCKGEDDAAKNSSLP